MPEKEGKSENTREIGNLKIPDDFVSKKRYKQPPKRDTETFTVVLNGTSDEEKSEYIPARDGDSSHKNDNAAQKNTADNCGFERSSQESDLYNRKVYTSSYSRKAANYTNQKSSVNKKPDKLLEVRCGTGPIIKRISVYSWGSEYGFYEKFIRDAHSYSSVAGHECPHVPFFSYIPQYAQMNRAQMSFYFYFRELVRNGKYPMVDCSYILLYIYEIINLSDVTNPQNGALLLSGMWLAYRKVYPMLDKYLSEWIPDYCLVHNVKLPEILFCILPQITVKSSFKEFYLEYAAANIPEDNGVLLADVLIEAYSDYDIKKSRYVGENEQLKYSVKKIFTETIMYLRNSGLFSEKLSKQTSVTRDAFCGSLCACSVKRRMNIEFSSVLRGVEARRAVTEILKMSENRVRKQNKIRSRLSLSDFDVKLKNVISELYASDSKESRKEEEYLSQYDSPHEEFSYETASEIERKSWDNTEILTDTGTEEPLGADDCVEPEGAIFSDIEFDLKDNTDISGVSFTNSGMAEPFGSENGSDNVNDSAPDNFVSALASKDENLKILLQTAAENARAEKGANFSATCRAMGLFADNAAAIINEISMDFFGDVILERGVSDYEFIEEYKEEIFRMLT